MTYFAVILIGRAIMGVGKTPAEAIEDAKCYEETCKSLPDDPTDEIYNGVNDGDWRLDRIPEAVFNYIEEHCSGGEDSYQYLLKYLSDVWERITGRRCQHD